MTYRIALTDGSEYEIPANEATVSLRDGWLTVRPLHQEEGFVAWPSGAIAIVEFGEQPAEVETETEDGWVAVEP